MLAVFHSPGRAMKPAGEPMSLADIEFLLRRASEVSNHRRFVVAGSLVAAGAVVRPPADMVMSRDLDFYPQLDPGRGFVEIAAQLGEGSAFHRAHGFYADPISPALLAVPTGWEQRLAPVSLAGGVVAFFIDPNDAAIGKLMRGEDNDVRWVRAGLAEGILSAPVIRARARTVSNAESTELERLEMILDSLDGA
jgi:hypothetical protein